jgi:DNA (cytosine-5)-methyltransferase 1
VLAIISERMPALVVLENVPSFASSLAGQLMESNLRRLGYHVYTTTLNPNLDWGEIEDRRRWLLVATLDRPFYLSPPGTPCVTPLSAYLDRADEIRDEADAKRIARTIDGLRAHNARHQALGHGFCFHVADPDATRIPTIPKSYHRINTGPFVQTPFGPRLLRQAEVERIHGIRLSTRQSTTALQILGQGVQTRLFREVFFQLARHLFPKFPEQLPNGRIEPPPLDCSQLDRRDLE